MRAPLGSVISTRDSASPDGGETGKLGITAAGQIRTGMKPSPAGSSATTVARA